MKRPMPCKAYKVELKSVGEIPLSAIDKVLRGQESDDCQEALQVLDILLKQKSAKQ
jgi:eukaryotic translation initiation factor 2C